MLNRFTKMLLVGTSVAPVLVVMAIDDFYSKGWPTSFTFGVQLLVIAASLTAIALLVMRAAERTETQIQRLTICKAKNSDKQVLTFLIAYLLPVISKHDYLFRDFNPPTIAMLGLLCLAVYHSNAFDFNPLLGLFGYHFYEIEDNSTFPYVLISRRVIKKPCQTLEVAQLFDYTFLLVDETEKEPQ